MFGGVRTFSPVLRALLGCRIVAAKIRRGEVHQAGFLPVWRRVTWYMCSIAGGYLNSGFVLCRKIQFSHLL